MNEQGVDFLIIKLIEGEISESESERLVLWIDQDEANRKYFHDFVEISHLLDIKKSTGVDIKPLDYDKNTAKVFNLSVWLRVAAVFIGIMAITFVAKEGFFDKESKAAIQEIGLIEKGSDKATLTLSSGTDVPLSAGEMFTNANASSDGKTIRYAAEGYSDLEAVYHYLTVPRGGQFQLTLTDGTMVWLNSESKIKYPTAFQNGTDRLVELIYGEAYFDVSPSTGHNGAKFKVVHGVQEVEVLGTEFNVRAYDNEENVYSTLVEGKVEVLTPMDKKSLRPGQQSILNKNGTKISVAQVDVFREVSWKDGIFSFKGESLREIMKVLARWFDMKVVFENSDLEEMTYNGTLRKDQSIEEILYFLKGSINTYRIEGKTLFIK